MRRQLSLDALSAALHDRREGSYTVTGLVKAYLSKCLCTVKGRAPDNWVSERSWGLNPIGTLIFSLSHVN